MELGLVLRDGAKAPPQHEGLQTSALNLEHLSRLERDKTLARNLRFIERRTQRNHRRVDCLVGQLKRAVMMRQRLPGAAIGQSLYRIRRIHVLILHEPARLIGADWEDRQPQRTMRVRHATEMPAVAIAGIADDVDFACGSLEDKTRPQRLVAIYQPPPPPVPRPPHRH